MPTDDVRELATRWREDAGGTYRTWFLWEERLKNFRSIRRGIEKVVAEHSGTTCGSPRTTAAGRTGAGGSRTAASRRSRPRSWPPAADFVPLIDVLWLERGTGRVDAAFEVEHTTTIQTGIMLRLDLAESQGGVRGLFLVAPDEREDEVRRQLQRPAFRRIGELNVCWLPYGELERNREAMARFGTGMKAVEAVEAVTRKLVKP